EIGYEGVSQTVASRLLNAALDAGLNVIDTAECYADSETLIGRAVSGRRREFHLFTKVGHAAGWSRDDWRPRAILKSIERGRERLPPDVLGAAARARLRLPRPPARRRGGHGAALHAQRARHPYRHRRHLQAGALEAERGSASGRPAARRRIRFDPRALA